MNPGTNLVPEDGCLWIPLERGGGNVGPRRPRGFLQNRAFSLLTFVYLYFFLTLFFWPRRAARGILVPRAGIEPRATAVEAPSPNHWTARERPFLLNRFFFKIIFSLFNGLGSVVKNQLTGDGEVYFWMISLIPLFYMSTIMLVPHCFVKLT